MWYAETHYLSNLAWALLQIDAIARLPSTSSYTKEIADPLMEAKRGATAPLPLNEASDQGNDLIRRAPGGYLWNQAFSLWLFFSLFLYQLVITRLLPVSEKGVYELVLTPANVAVYLAALGLESAGSVYVPRMLGQGGPGKALAVSLRLIAIRLAAVLLIAIGILWGLPALANLLAVLALPGASALVQALRDPSLLAHRIALVAYVLGMGLANLLAALLTALLRTRIIFIAGSLAQLLTIGLAYLFVGPLHGGADSALMALALPNFLLALTYLGALAYFLGTHPTRIGKGMTGRMVRLGLAAWVADLANEPLVKLIAIAQLSIAVPPAQIAFFGIAFEMGHAAAYLFVAGLGGVGLAVMSAAYIQRQLAHLALAWRTVTKLQVLLAVPLLAFCIPYAELITRTLYGQNYTDAGPPLALFLTLNALVRLCGGGAHEAALYVLGRQRWVVLTRSGSLVVLIVADALLIPTYGVVGALIAVGLTQLVAEAVELLLARLALAQPFPLSFVLRVLLALVPALAVSLFWRPTTLAGLVLAGMLYAAIFLVSLYLTRPLDSEDAALLRRMNGPLPAILSRFARTPLG
jgi:O-antigen/teichoic acid export membrane protein